MNFPPDLPLSKPSTIWEHAGITCATILGPLGSYNGYCVLPAGHELAAKHLQSEPIPHVHGGVTYGPVIVRDGRSVIGWDTSHAGDYNELIYPYGRRWTEEDVIKETNRLAEQIASSPGEVA